MTLTVGPMCQVLPRGRGDFRWRFLRDGEVSGQTKGTIVIPDSNDSIDPLFLTAEPPEGARHRSWRLGGGARRYAGALSR